MIEIAFEVDAAGVRRGGSRRCRDTDHATGCRRGEVPAALPRHRLGVVCRPHLRRSPVRRRSRPRPRSASPSVICVRLHHRYLLAAINKVRSRRLGMATPRSWPTAMQPATPSPTSSPSPGTRPAFLKRPAAREPSTQPIHGSAANSSPCGWLADGTSSTSGAEHARTLCATGPSENQNYRRTIPNQQLHNRSGISLAQVVGSRRSLPVVIPSPIWASKFANTAVNQQLWR